MAAVCNSRDIALAATSPRTVAVTIPGGVDFDNVTGGNKPSNNADVTQAALVAGVSITGGGVTLSSGGALKGGKTTYGSGTGVFLGYHSGAYKLDVGSGSSYVRWTGTALDIIGDITGASNIDISGSADF